MSEEMTFQEITQIALGGVDFKSVNITLLYAVIDLLLKKLNCEHEKVTITGVPAQRLQELLCQSNSGPLLVFQYDKMTEPIKPYEKLDELEKQIKKLETNLDEHIEHVKHFKDVGDNQDESDTAVIPCTLFCEVEEPKSEIIGALLKNKWFFGQLNEFLKFPPVCRFNKLDIKFRKLEEDLRQFQKKSISAHKRLNKMEELFVNLIEFQKTIRENYNEFRNTMQEIQEVMDSKVNNVQMPSLKRSIQFVQRRLANEVNFLVYTKTKPRALLCIADPTDSFGKVSRSIIRRFTRDAKREFPCGCDESLLHQSLTYRLDHLDTNAFLRRSTNEAISFRTFTKSGHKSH